MLVPDAAFIMIAYDRLNDKKYRKDNAFPLIQEVKEAERALPNLSHEAYFMYMLGFETARVILEGLNNGGPIPL